MKKQFKFFIAVFLIGALIIGTFLYCSRKESIHNATVIELDNVQDIGEVLSKQIYSYVQTNSIDNVGELKGHIKYLGDKRIDNLKKKYK